MVSDGQMTNFLPSINKESSHLGDMVLDFYELSQSVEGILINLVGYEMQINWDNEYDASCFLM